MLNLDTHILVFALTGQLRPAERRLLEGQPWGISDIVLWELAKLAQLRRITMNLDDPDVRNALKRLQIWPITPEIAVASGRLDFRSDPADEIIAATSVVHQVPLVTRDDRIRTSKIVPLA